MGTTIYKVLAKPRDYFVCEHCNMLNWYENDMCRDCNNLPPYEESTIDEIAVKSYDYAKDELDFYMAEYGAEDIDEEERYSYDDCMNVTLDC